MTSDECECGLFGDEHVWEECRRRLIAKALGAERRARLAEHETARTRRSMDQLRLRLEPIVQQLNSKFAIHERRMHPMTHLIEEAIQESLRGVPNWPYPMGGEDGG